MIIQRATDEIIEQLLDTPRAQALPSQSREGDSRNYLTVISDWVLGPEEAVEIALNRQGVVAVPAER